MFKNSAKVSSVLFMSDTRKLIATSKEGAVIAVNFGGPNETNIRSEAADAFKLETSVKEQNISVARYF